MRAAGAGPHWPSLVPNDLLYPGLVLAQVGVDPWVATLSTALHPPGHQALELSIAHQGSPGVTLRGRDRDGDACAQRPEPRARRTPEAEMGMEVG